MPKSSYINDLVIECEQNLKVLEKTGKAINDNGFQDHYTFEGTYIGNIERFEVAYPPLFIFNKNNRILFHKYMNKIKEYPRRMIMDMAYATGGKNYLNPYSSFKRDEFTELLNTLTEFKAFLEKAFINDNNFRF